MHIPSTHGVGVGDEDGAGLGVGAGGLDGDPLGEPRPGVLDALLPGAGLVLAVALALAWAEGVGDGFLPPCLAPGLVVPGVAAALVPAAPPTGLGTLDALDARWDGTAMAGTPLVGDPGGVRSAEGAVRSAPEKSSPARPPTASRTAPAASAPARRRRGRCGGPA
jgi:hypothetical protein